MDDEQRYDTYDTNKKNLIKALEKSMNLVTVACKMCKLSRETFYRYRREDKKFDEDVKAVKEVVLDFGESALYKNMREGKEASIIFFLKTKGKERGYVEDKTTGADITVKIEGSKRGLDHIEEDE